jgi:hypothetical protein
MNTKHSSGRTGTGLIGVVILSLAAHVTGQDQWEGSDLPIGDIYRSGDVGIGLSDDPNYGFEVKKNTILFERSNGRANSWFPYTNGEVYISGYSPGSGTGDIHFRDDNGSSYTEHMVIEGTTGRIGMGNANPDCQLDILDLLKFDDESNFPGEGSINEGYWPTYVLGETGSNRTLRLGVVNDGYTKAEIEIENNNDWKGWIHFKTAWGAGALTRMTITGDGRVGIGTTSPSRELHVDGWIQSDVVEIVGGSDIAEPFQINDVDGLAPGMVVSIDTENPGRLRITD